MTLRVFQSEGGGLQCQECENPRKKVMFLRIGDETGGSRQTITTQGNLDNWLKKRKKKTERGDKRRAETAC